MPKQPHPRPQAARSKTPPSRPSASSTHNPQAPYAFELVDPGWILKALAAMLALALVFGYLTICIVFSRTQWELVLHPSRSITATPAALGLAFTPVHFADDNAGQPQLDGWWIPAAPAPNASNLTAATAMPHAFTAVLLHGASGSISDALPQATTLHNAGLNVLLFDYRGFGRSGGHHPTAAFMQADAESAFSYLTVTRGISPARILAYGNGLGASLAIRLCAQHPQIAALILEAPDGDLEPRVRSDVRSHLLPVGLLFHEDFPLAAPLHTLTTPKLLISFATNPAPLALQCAANPKLLFETQPTNQAGIESTLSRFLSSYVVKAKGFSNL
jgi:pimeloyl-ACP methyl ester carboxylesterase